MIGAIIAKKKTKSAYDHLNKRDIKKFLASWHNDSIWVFPGELPISGKFEGKPAIEKWFKNFMDQFPDIKITPKYISIQNILDFVGTNVVVVIWDEVVTNREGDKFQFSGATIINLKLGKATFAQEYIFNNEEELKRAWSFN